MSLQYSGGCSNMYSLLHPLRLVVGTKRNTTKQDRRVKFHTDVVPEWTKWVPILKINQNHPSIIRAMNTVNSSITVKRLGLRPPEGSISPSPMCLYCICFQIKLILCFFTFTYYLKSVRKEK